MCRSKIAKTSVLRKIARLFSIKVVTVYIATDCKRVIISFIPSPTHSFIKRLIICQWDRWQIASQYNFNLQFI